MPKFKVRVNVPIFNGVRRVQPGEVIEVDRKEPPKWGTLVVDPVPPAEPPAEPPTEPPADSVAQRSSSTHKHRR
jgi:hypothetical protein